MGALAIPWLIQIRTHFTVCLGEFNDVDFINVCAILCRTHRAKRGLPRELVESLF